NTVPLLRSASIALITGRTQYTGLEFTDSFKNGHPAFLYRLDAQSEICAEFGVGFADESSSKEPLLRRTSAACPCLVTVPTGASGVGRGDNPLAGHSRQHALRFLKFRHQTVRSRRASQGD